MSEYYKGNDGNYSQADLTSLDSKLTAAKLLENFTFYATAAQQCDKVRNSFKPFVLIFTIYTILHCVLLP